MVDRNGSRTGRSRLSLSHLFGTWRRRAVGGLAGAALAGFPGPAGADPLVLTLDENTVPDGLECEEDWVEEGLSLRIGAPDEPDCAGVNLCSFFSRPTRIDLVPGRLTVDLTPIAPIVGSVEVDVSSVCAGCAIAVLHQDDLEVDTDANVQTGFGGEPADTLRVSSGGVPVDRLSLIACFETSVFEIRIFLNPPTSVRQPVSPSERLAIDVAPNPFATETRVSFTARRPGLARVTVHDARGRTVAVLHEGSLHDGLSRRWDGRDRDGLRVPAGVYFVRLEVEGRSHARKITRLE